MDQNYRAWTAEDGRMVLKGSGVGNIAAKLNGRWVTGTIRLASYLGELGDEFTELLDSYEVERIRVEADEALLSEWVTSRKHVSLTSADIAKLPSALKGGSNDTGPGAQEAGVPRRPFPSKGGASGAVKLPNDDGG